MADLVSELKQQFTYIRSSKALLSKPAGEKYGVFFLDIPDLGVEFSDVGALIVPGANLEGFLLFNNRRDLDPTTSGPGITYVVEQATSQQKAYVLIQFYDPEKKCFAKFIGEDSRKSVTAVGLNGYEGRGVWNPCDLGTVAAVIKQEAGAQRATIDVRKNLRTIGYIETNGALGKSEINVTGVFTFKGHLTDVTIMGLYAEWNTNGIVFTQESGGSVNFGAYFTPSEFESNSLGEPGKPVQFPVEWHVFGVGK